MSRTLGQYELVQRIGSGGMAEVWMGRRAAVGRASKAVAIKLMAPRVARDPRYRRMFLDEARLSMLMSHSNVVQVFDAGEQDGRLYLAMEWVDGMDLARLLEPLRRRGEPWSPRLSAYVIGEVLQGLGYAHRLVHEGEPLCVVHRDISPHNVLVSTSGEVKIADFGVARLATEDTSGMHVKGKLRYMAPEHLAGRTREPTVDLYGAGAVLHEMLTASRYRDEVDEVELHARVLSGRVPPLSVPGVPPELASLREGLLRAEPRQRIPSAERALEYLHAWAGYRSAAGELARLCREAMGVDAPRSSIGSAPSEAVDALADTEAAEAVTRTTGPRPAPDRETVPLGPERRASEGPRRRVVLGWGLGVLGAGGLGAIGVLWSAERDGGDGDGDFAGSGSGSAPMLGSDRGTSKSGESGGEGSPSVALERSGATGGSSTGERSVGGDGSSTGGRSVSGVPSNESSGSGGSSRSDGPELASSEMSSDAADDEPSRADWSAADDEPGSGHGGESVRSRTPEPAIVEIGLRSPLRTARVRIGRGKAHVVAPRAELRVPAGRPRIDWKPAGGQVWIEGRRFRFEAGRRYSIRLTSTGPVLE